MTSRIGNSAFTLVEVLLTIAILAIGLIGIIRAYGGLLNASEVSNEYIDAVCLAKEKMAEVELDELQNKGLTLGTTYGKAQGIYGNFKWEETVEPSDAKNLNILKVSIYKKDDVNSRKFSLESYVGNKE